MLYDSFRVGRAITKITRAMCFISYFDSCSRFPFFRSFFFFLRTNVVIFLKINSRFVEIVCKSGKKHQIKACLKCCPWIFNATILRTLVTFIFIFTDLFRYLFKNFIFTIENWFGKYFSATLKERERERGKNPFTKYTRNRKKQVPNRKEKKKKKKNVNRYARVDLGSLISRRRRPLAQSSRDKPGDSPKKKERGEGRGVGVIVIRV